MRKRAYWAFISLLAVSLGWGTTVQAEVPPLVRYQGQLVNSQGVPLEGPYDLTFRLYAAETGGPALWTELHGAVAITAGQFSVLLGSVASLAQEDWSQPRWLSIQVGVDPELSPRQRISSVPLALRAATAEELATPITTSTITDDANKLVPAGAVILWTGGSCPSGYTRLSALDGRFIVGGNSYQAAAGGSNTHAHGPGSYVGPSHLHPGTTNVGTPPPGGGDSGMSSNPISHVHTFTTDYSGTQPITGTSATTDSRPAFATVLLCQKD